MLKKNSKGGSVLRIWLLFILALMLLLGSGIVFPFSDHMAFHCFRLLKISFVRVTCFHKFTETRLAAGKRSAGCPAHKLVVQINEYLRDIPRVVPRGDLFAS